MSGYDVGVLLWLIWAGHPGDHLCVVPPSPMWFGCGCVALGNALCEECESTDPGTDCYGNVYRYENITVPFVRGPSDVDTVE